MPRPKSFDPETALAKAMDVFWDKGYDAASIADLTAAMGINRFSLYDTFGDKHTLYLKALDSYERRVVDPMLDKIRAIETLDDLESHFERMIERRSDPADSPCCMVQKAAISAHTNDASICDHVARSRARVHDAFSDVFARLTSKGEIRAGIAPEQAAWLVMLTHAGLTSHGVSPLPAAQVRSAIAVLFDALRA
jgi:TetR/AcrR family transcriptional repressor of nem operon